MDPGGGPPAPAPAPPAPAPAPPAPAKPAIGLCPITNANKS